MPPTLHELCESFRAREGETAFAASLIRDRVEARKLLAAFGVAPMPPWTCPKMKAPSNDRLLWLWVWSGYDGGPMAPTFLDGLAQLALISVESAHRVWPAIMISRVVYPDGQLSGPAKTILDIPLRAGPGRPAAASPRLPAAQPPTEPKKE